MNLAQQVSCVLCKNDQTALIYNCEQVPVFQNKCYPSENQALQCPTSSIQLKYCHHCGFVFNSAFTISHMNYDHSYQNEQAYSEYFRRYLEMIVQLFREHSFQDKKIIEIGCGKGFFLDFLTQQGFEISGFDPAYTGDHPKITKDYFDRRYSLEADVIVLRHVLEHIEKPFEFLHEIKAAVKNDDAQIYIEVPSLEWIIKNNAFWDIFYEHCNYFTLDSLSSLFSTAQTGFLFNDQYLYLVSNLSCLLQNTNKQQQAKNTDFTLFYERMSRYHEVIPRKYEASMQNIFNKRRLLVWGAGAKGVTFVNLVDPERKYISCLIDINPKKQNLFVAKTAHPIVSPEKLHEFKGSDILIMNDNYFSEIQALVNTNDFNLFTLDDFYNQS